MQSTFPKWKLAAFTLLSACDFAVTYWVLSRSTGAVYESNPVANEWLQTGGWLGLAVFKSAIVVGVAVIATYLFYRRPRIAHDLLALGCGALIVAVLTGTTIAVTRDNHAAYDETDFAGNNPTPVHDVTDPRTAEYIRVMDDSGIRLVTKEFTLQQCVEYLATTELAQDPAWIDSLRRAYPRARENLSLLAADLINHTVSSRLRTPLAAELAKRLENDFRNLYGAVPVFPYRTMLHLNGSPSRPRPRTRTLPIPPA